MVDDTTVSVLLRYNHSKRSISFKSSALWGLVLSVAKLIKLIILLKQPILKKIDGVRDTKRDLPSCENPIH